MFTKWSYLVIELDHFHLLIMTRERMTAFVERQKQVIPIKLLRSLLTSYNPTTRSEIMNKERDHRQYFTFGYLHFKSKVKISYYAATISVTKTSSDVIFLVRSFIKQEYHLKKEITTITAPVFRDVLMYCGQMKRMTSQQTTLPFFSKYRTKLTRECLTYEECNVHQSKIYSGF